MRLRTEKTGRLVSKPLPWPGVNVIVTNSAFTSAYRSKRFQNPWRFSRTWPRRPAAQATRMQLLFSTSWTSRWSGSRRRTSPLALVAPLLEDRLAVLVLAVRRLGTVLARRARARHFTKSFFADGSPSRGPISYNRWTFLNRPSPSSRRPSPATTSATQHSRRPCRRRWSMLEAT